MCTVIPPNTVQLVTKESGQNIDGDIILQSCNNHKDLLVPHTVIKLKDRQILIKLCNPTNKFVTLKKGYNVKYLEEVCIIFDKELVADEESNCSIHKYNADMENQVQGCVEFLLKAAPVKGTTTWAHEKSMYIDAFFVYSLEDITKVIPNLVKDLFVRSRVNLNDEHKIVFILFLTEFADIFAKYNTGLGCFSTVQHRIDTEDSKAICQ